MPSYAAIGYHALSDMMNRRYESKIRIISLAINFMTVTIFDFCLFVNYHDSRTFFATPENVTKRKIILSNDLRNAKCQIIRKHVAD